MVEKKIVGKVSEELLQENIDIIYERQALNEIFNNLCKKEKTVIKRRQEFWKKASKELNLDDNKQYAINNFTGEVSIIEE